VRKKSYLTFGVLIALLWIGWSIWRRDAEPGATSPKATDSSPAGPTGEPRQSGPLVDPSPEVAFLLNSPAHDIRTELRLVSETIETFRSNFPHDGNPTGSNAEITAALTGRNKLRFAFIPPKHPAINRDGELCDRWGTPLFFHAESATRMEIRSAGPDRRMWTDDDVSFAP
jgi:hypothetical protein